MSEELSEEQKKDRRRAQKREWTSQNRRKNGVKPLKVSPCGTVSGYRRHLRNGETPDAACRAAWAEEARKRRKNKKAGATSNAARS